jgi:hypothetical protein
LRLVPDGDRAFPAPEAAPDRLVEQPEVNPVDNQSARCGEIRLTSEFQKAIGLEELGLFLLDNHL